MTDLVISTVNAIMEQDLVDDAVGEVIALVDAWQAVIEDEENDPELEGLPELVDGDDEESDDGDEDPPNYLLSQGEVPELKLEHYLMKGYW